MWCGHADGPSVSVAGNILAGPAVVGGTLATFLADRAHDLPARLLGAMQAGQRAGGDARGQQSAALRLVTTEDFPDLCLRADDHARPLDELERLLALWRRDRAPGLATQPRKADPAGLVDLDAIDARFAAAGSALRVRR
jgi:uncharacterized Ntn-hydrolase superfamily protein